MRRFYSSLILKILLASSLWFAVGEAALAAKGDTSLFLFLGEAYGPGNVRVGFAKFDLGIDLRSVGFYGGPRLWLGQAYVGTGPFTTFTDLGLYGILGYEMSLFKIPLLKIAGEFWSIGTVLGRTYAVGTIGLGVAW